VLQTDTLYKFSARHRSAEGPVSAWAEVQARTMLVFPGYAALVVGYDSSPFVNLYTRDADTFTLQTTDAPSETSAVLHAVFSDDDEYLALALISTPRFRVYKRTDGSYSTITNPSTLPSAQPEWVTLTPDASHASICGGSSLIIYKREESGGSPSFVAISNPSEMPSVGGGFTSCNFSGTGTYFAITTAAESDNVYLYKRTGDNFTRVGLLNNPIESQIFRGVFSYDDAYFVAANYSSVLFIFKKSGDDFVHLVTLNEDLYVNQMQSLEFSKDGKWLAAANKNRVIYSIENDVFTKIDDPDVETTSFNVRRVSFSKDSNYVALTDISHPYVLIYKKVGNNFLKLPNPAQLPSFAGLCVAFSRTK
jgi:hypothetical protein